MATAYVSSVPEKVSLKPDPAPKQKEYKVEQVKLSENIRKFDSRPRVYTENPFSHNAVSLKKDEPKYTPTASELIVDPLYNSAAKVLGVDTVHNWSGQYDKVYEVVQWAQEKSGLKDPQALVRWIYDKAQSSPSLGSSRLDDVHIFSKISRKEVKPAPKKPQVSTKTFVDKWIKKTLGGLNVG